jgi:hypothetical protein
MQPNWKRVLCEKFQSPMLADQGFYNDELLVVPLDQTCNEIFEAFVPIGQGRTRICQSKRKYNSVQILAEYFGVFKSRWQNIVLELQYLSHIAQEIVE